MIRAMFKKEFTQYWRDGRVATVLAMTLALAAIALLTGWNEVSTLERERAAAVEMDREIWDNQGDKNPHTAAHFSRYAFQPTYNLAVFDRGLTSFIGNAIWLEAHYRDPAALRPIDNAVEIQRIAELSPAWVVRVFIPFLIVLLLFGSIAAEREAGTLRQLLSSGARTSSIIGGKAIAGLTLSACVLAAILLAVWLLMQAPGIDALPDTGARLAGLTLAYTAYLAIFVLFSIGFSSLFRTSRSALAGLLAVWAISTVLAPKLAPDIAAALAPSPAASEFAERLHSESSDPFWGSSDEAAARRQQVTDDLLEEYGVDSIEALPINYDGYLLQASEEYANQVFDTLYDELWGAYERQRDLSRLFAIVSPTIALENISMALSGTDLAAHRHFADQAELFRREFVRLLNQEMIDNGGADGYAYQSGNEFWQQNPDFEYVAPGIGFALQGIWIDALIVLGWLLAAAGLLAVGVNAGLKWEKQA